MKGGCNMHKLIEYVCDELEELERKADKEGKLSMAEIQYVDTLSHIKKNLLKGEEMMEEGNSYARGRGRNARRDSMGRYSSEYDNSSYRDGGNSSYENSSYRGGNSSYEGGNSSYRRGRSGARGRSGDMEELKEHLEKLEHMVQDNEAKQMIKEWKREIE